MKIEDKPIWYDVYEAFPPKVEPKFDRPAPNIPVRSLFYEEDIIRAYLYHNNNIPSVLIYYFLSRKYHKFNTSLQTVNLSDSRNQSQTQIFIDLFNKYKGEGALSDEKIFETANDMLQEKMQDLKNERTAERQNIDSVDSGLVSSFTEAKNSTPSVNIKDIFKD